jgi:hypothetical protein
MSRIRNPRYAPEFLERRLSPSDPGTSLPAVQVCLTAPPKPDPTPMPDGDGSGSIPDPTPSTGPGNPA